MPKEACSEATIEIQDQTGDHQGDHDGHDNGHDHPGLHQPELARAYGGCLRRQGTYKPSFNLHEGRTLGLVGRPAAFIHAPDIITTGVKKLRVVCFRHDPDNLRHRLGQWRGSG